MALCDFNVVITRSLRRNSSAFHRTDSLPRTRVSETHVAFVLLELLGLEQSPRPLVCCGRMTYITREGMMHGRDLHSAHRPARHRHEPSVAHSGANCNARCGRHHSAPPASLPRSARYRDRSRATITRSREDGRVAHADARLADARWPAAQMGPWTTREHARRSSRPLLGLHGAWIF